MVDQPSNLVAKYVSGNADTRTLNDKIKKAWSAILADPVESAKIAKLLEVPASDLKPDEPPFKANQTGSGMTGGEVLIAITVGFAIGFAKETGGQLGKAASEKVKKLWTEHMSDRVNPPGSGDLGAPKE